jgi:hypothetical protein
VRKLNDLNPVPDGEKTAEMACTCVFVVVMTIIGMSIAIMFMVHHMR